MTLSAKFYDTIARFYDAENANLTDDLAELIHTRFGVPREALVGRRLEEFAARVREEAR